MAIMAILAITVAERTPRPPSASATVLNYRATM